MPLLLFYFFFFFTCLYACKTNTVTAADVWRKKSAHTEKRSNWIIGLLHASSSHPALQAAIKWLHKLEPFNLLFVLTWYNLLFLCLRSLSVPHLHKVHWSVTRLAGAGRFRPHAEGWFRCLESLEICTLASPCPANRNIDCRLKAAPSVRASGRSADQRPDLCSCCSCGRRLWAHSKLRWICPPLPTSLHAPADLLEVVSSRVAAREGALEGFNVAGVRSERTTIGETGCEEEAFSRSGWPEGFSC